MTNMFSNLRARLDKHAKYSHTVNELRAMPLSVAIDVGFFHEDAQKVAAKAVYGA